MQRGNRNELLQWDTHGVLQRGNTNVGHMWFEGLLGTCMHLHGVFEDV